MSRWRGRRSVVVLSGSGELHGSVPQALRGFGHVATDANRAANDFLPRGRRGGGEEAGRGRGPAVTRATWVVC